MVGSILPVLTSVSAQQPLTKEEFQKLLPAALSAADLNTVKEIASSNSDIQKIINGRPYEFMAQDFVGNVYANPVVWQPEIHINVANSAEVTAVIDLGSRSVSSVTTLPIMQFTPPNSFQSQGGSSTHSWASDYYSESTIIDGVNAYSYAPSHGQSSSTTNEALLLNAVEAGANDNNLCSAAYYASSYFAQVGYLFATGSGLTKGGYLLYTDTAFACAGQYPNVNYNIGDLWQFTITSSSSGWVISGYDQTTGQSYSYTRTGVTYNYMKDNDFNMGTFFENMNTGTGWSSQFFSNPSMTSATIRPQSNHVWTNWNSDAEQDSKCNGTPYNDNQNAMSGNLVSGGTTTWSMSYIDTHLQAC
jgi:hypothetical protein